MKTPFNKETFSQVMKPRLSMAHLSLEYENIESTIYKECTEMRNRIGAVAYDTITDYEVTPSSEQLEDAIYEAALDYMQRAILHYSLYHHIIYLIANVSNDGVTVTKSDDKTTLYKYQQDQLEQQLLIDAHFWMNRLLGHLIANSSYFGDWAHSNEGQQLTSLPVTITDFDYHTGIDDLSFLLYASWIVREVEREQVIPRIGDQTVIYTNAIKRAICYETVGRACQRLAYHCLPTPIRYDINNEMGKNHAAQEDTHIRQTVAGEYLKKAAAYWTEVETEQQRNELIAAMYPQPKRITESQPFAW